MGGVPDKLPDSPMIRELHKRWNAGENPITTRIKEDEAAIALLGATLKRMTVWLDCIYRTSPDGKALYTTEAALFGGVHPDDPAAKWLPTIVLPPDEPVRVLYAPLAAGHHVDHQIVRDWAIELRKGNSQIALKFYEDYPYSQEAGVVERALDYFEKKGLSLTQEPSALTTDHMTAKTRAIAEYRSQVGSFWLDGDVMEHAVRRAALNAGNGSFAERFWVLR
jgi:hypothetical protein